MCQEDEQNERDVSTEKTIGMQSAVKVFLNGLLPKNVLVAGLSLRTLSLPLQSGLPMALRWVLEMFMALFCQGPCTGPDGMDILCECGNAKVVLSSPLVWLFLLLLDHSSKTLSPSGVGGGRFSYDLLWNFSFQLRASGFFYWIVTAFLHFVVFWTLTWSNVVSWCNVVTRNSLVSFVA